MKIEINGKGLLAIALLSSSLVVADYVSVANVKDAGGVNVIGVDQEEVDSSITDAITAAKLEMNPVGSIVFRMDNVDPSTIYGGTWSLITGDATVGFGSGNILTGSVVGSNTKSVPLKNHSHSASSNSAGSHDHSIRQTTSAYTGTHAPAWYADATYVPRGLKTGSPLNRTTGSNAGPITHSGAHSHTISIGTTGDGSTTPTINVKGAVIELNVWKRIS